MDDPLLITLRRLSRSILPPYPDWGEKIGAELRLLLQVKKAGLQDCRLVALRSIGLRTARQILTQRGEIDLDEVKKVLLHWNLWTPQWPELMDGLEESLASTHKQLTRLVNEKPMRQLLMSCGKPIGQPIAEQRIRLSCQLPANAPVGDYEARLAVLSALLTPLRQSVGSCFATAVCILVQREDPSILLDDLRAMIELGKLERIVDGQSNTVPFALRWAGGLVMRPIPARATALWRDPGFLYGALAAGLVTGPLPALALRRAIRALGKEGFSGSGRSIQELYQRLGAQLLDLPWPIPEASAEGQDLLMGGAAVRLLRKRESWQEKVQQATEVFSAAEHHPLLKSWEYTVASFVEARPTMAAHNLWTALGLASEEPDSVGGALKNQLQPALDDLQEQIEQAVQMANQCVARVESVRSRSGHLRDERDAEWAQLEARGAKRDYDYAQGRLSQLEENAEQIAGFPRLFAQIVEKLLPRYFQEAYDPALTGQVLSLYDDAPAGFRLVFKGGIDFVPSWKWVEDGAQYRLAMREFFERCFFEVRDAPEVRLIGPEINRLGQTFSLILDEPHFQLGALKRLAEAHQRTLPSHALENLDRVTYKPWAYESGGTLLGLTQHYFGLPELPSFEQKNCERAVDLVAFLIDQLRLLPEHQTRMLSAPTGDLLAYSPTHAFNLLGGGPCLRLCREDDLYPYTLLGREWLDIQEQFWRTCRLQSGNELDRILENWIGSLPESIQPAGSLAAMGLPRHLSPIELLEIVQRAFPERLAQQSAIHTIMARLESQLFEECPLLAEFEAIAQLEKIFSEIPTASLHLACRVVGRDIEGAKGRRQAVQLASLLSNLPLSTQEIVKRLRQSALMVPESCIWADTNWPFFYFGLVWSPREQTSSLWRVSALGDLGMPMVEWTHYLSPGNEEPWGWLNRPSDYRQRVTSGWMLHHRGRLIS